MIRLKLLSRSYCHLCENMLDALGRHPARPRFEVEVVDVDADPALEERYGILVPVLLHEEVEICHYHFDAARLEAFLAGF